jgi:hypothetical protein
MRPRPLLIAAAVAAATVAHATPLSDSLLQDRLVGSWAGTGDCTDFALTFNADGTFSLRSSDPPIEEHGTFAIKDGHLAGTSDKRDMPDVAVIFDRDELVLGPERMLRCPKP